MSAERGMTEWTANGVDYTINDPNVAEEFDPTKAYHVRDHVYYQGNLYVFVAEHAAGAWNTSHVLLFKVGAELANLWNANATEATLRAAADSDLKSAIDQTGTRMEWTSGGFIVASTGLVGESTNAYSYSDFIPIEAEYLYLHTHMVGAGGVAFYDVNRDYISGFSVDNNPSPYVFDGAIPVPQTAKYFRATTRGYTQEAFYLAGGVADIMDFKRLQAVVASMGEFPITWQDNAYVYGAGNSRGYTNSDATYAVTNYIPVKPGMKIHVKTWLTGQAGICFFTSEAPSASVSGIINEDYTSPYLYEETIEVPSSANYMRVSCRRKKNEAEITLDVIQTIMNINMASVDWTYAGLDRVNATGQFEAQMNSYLAYKNTKFLSDNGTRFYLVPKAKVTSGTGGCLKIFADNYPSQGDYRDLGIYFSANQNGDTGYYGNGVDWINVKVYDDGEYKNKHPDLGFSFQDGAVVAGKVICFDGQKPYWVFGASTPTLHTYCCAEFSSNIGIVANGGGILMRSPNGTLYKVGVANDGTLTVNPVN
jgi:hypothetical protein